jgi:hypothetical protein
MLVIPAKDCILKCFGKPQIRRLVKHEKPMVNFEKYPTNETFQKILPNRVENSGAIEKSEEPLRILKTIRGSYLYIVPSIRFQTRIENLAGVFKTKPCIRILQL